MTCSIFIPGWGKCPKCIIPQTHCEGPQGSALSPSVGSGFQMFPSNGLSAHYSPPPLCSLGEEGGIQSPQYHGVAHIQQLIGGFNPISFARIFHTSGFFFFFFFKPVIMFINVA